MRSAAVLVVLAPAPCAVAQEAFEEEAITVVVTASRRPGTRAVASLVGPGLRPLVAE